MKGLHVRVLALFLCVGLALVVFFNLFLQDSRKARSAILEVEQYDHYGQEQGSKISALSQHGVSGTQAQNTSTKKPRAEPPDYLIPSDAELEQMNENMWMKIYWKYINRLQVLCKDILRIGKLKDGGKEICVDEPYRPKAPCIVYSFGINYQWDFDKAIVKAFGCQVFAFDPSMTNNSQQIDENIWFYKLGLGPENTVNQKGWQIYTLDEIRRNLGHENRTIDILKIDVEGDEWLSLLQMISVGALHDVKQISMETHFLHVHFPVARYWGDVASSKPLAALRRLYEAGFRIFMRERNEWSFQSWPGMKSMIANVNEISLIKI